MRKFRKLMKKMLMDAFYEGNYYSTTPETDSFKLMKHFKDWYKIQNKRPKATKEEAIAWYESLPDEERTNLQKEFGHDGVPDREKRMYKWLRSKMDTKTILKVNRKKIKNAIK